MARNSEHRSYSVDEMMEKLRAGEREKRRSEDAELVTRPDGTQVMRVRKRKRRSNQPAKSKQRRQRRLGLIALVVLVMILVGAGSGLVVLLAKFNGKNYRETLKERLHTTTGAQIGVSDFSVTPFKSQAKSVQFAWPASGIPKTLKLNDLEADLKPSSFLGSRLKGGEVLARTGVMILGPPEGISSPSVKEGEFPLKFRSYRSPRFELLFGEDVSAPTLRIHTSELTARRRSEGGLRLTLSGGQLEIAKFASLRIDNALGEWSDGQFTLVSLFAQSEDGGEAIFRGAQPITTNDPTVFDIELKSFPLNEMLGASDLGRMLDGVVDAPSGSLSFDPAKMDSGSVEMQFTAKAGTLEGLRFLGGLSGIFNKNYYARPDGGVIEGVYHRDRNGVRIEDFKFETRQNMDPAAARQNKDPLVARKNKDPLAVMGRIEVKLPSGALSGTLSIGVPPDLVMETLTKMKARYRAFKPHRLGDSYCWIDIELGGTIDQPEDTFLDQVGAAPRILPGPAPQSDPGAGLPAGE